AGPVALTLRMELRAPVHLLRGREETRRALLLRESERVPGSQCADLERRDRVTEVVDGRRGAREVQNRVDRAVQVQRFRQVVIEIGETVVLRQLVDVRATARDEVVDADDLLALGEEPGAEVVSEEPRSPGADDTHRW